MIIVVMTVFSEVRDAQSSLKNNPDLATNYLCSFLPKGVYDLKVTSVQIKQRQKHPQIPYFVINLVVSSGDYKGYIGADIIGASEEYLPHAISKMESLLKLSGKLIPSSYSSLSEYASNVSSALEGTVFRAACQQSVRGQQLKVSYFNIASADAMSE